MLLRASTKSTPPTSGETFLWRIWEDKERGHNKKKNKNLTHIVFFNEFILTFSPQI